MDERTRTRPNRGAPVRFGDQLRHQFPELDPHIEDLLLLEAHQVARLPQRAPPPELAAVLHAHPWLARHFVARCPSVEAFVTRLLSEHPPVTPAALAACEDAVVWELGDWIVYQRAPGLYDAASGVDFALAAITDVVAPEGKVVLDAGAGTGRVAFSVAPHARVVFAIEPVATLRSFMREKAVQRGVDNIFVLDGFLHAIPLPQHSVDVLLTCQAVGWSLPEELAEIERVVKPGGIAQHLFGAPVATADSPLMAHLIADGYTPSHYEKDGIVVRSFWRQIST